MPLLPGILFSCRSLFIAKNGYCLAALFGGDCVDGGDCGAGGAGGGDTGGTDEVGAAGRIGGNGDSSGTVEGDGAVVEGDVKTSNSAAVSASGCPSNFAGRNRI